jgi:drug/metabolite transporter (DMT)-like permease
VSTAVQYILLSGIFFSISHATVKYLQNIHISQLVLVRGIFALAFTLFLIRKYKLSIKTDHTKILLMRGFAGTSALFMYFYCLQNMPLATAVTIQYLSPIFMIFFTFLFYKEKFNPWQLPFIFLAFIGVAIVKNFSPDISLKLFLLALSASMLAGLAYTFIRMLAGKVSPYVVIFYFAVMTVPLAAPFSIYYWKQPNLKEWGLLVLVGVFTFVAQTFMTKAFHSDKASKIGPFKYVGLIFSAFIGHYFFKEHLNLQSYFGIFVIILGVYLNNYISSKA